LEFNVPFQHKYGYIRDENKKCGWWYLALNWTEVAGYEYQFHVDNKAAFALCMFMLSHYFEKLLH